MLNEKLLKIGFTLLFIFFLLLSPLPLQGGNTLSIKELLSHPNRYNNQEVTVKGKVSDIQITNNKFGRSILFSGWQMKKEKPLRFSIWEPWFQTVKK